MARDLRTKEAEQYRKLYWSKRWSGPQGVRTKTLIRDRFICQRCGCAVIADGDGKDPRSAVVNHKRPHRGNLKLFFDLNNLETVCKQDHDALIRREEARGHMIGNDINGRPTDPSHAWNQA